MGGSCCGQAKPTCPQKLRNLPPQREDIFRLAEALDELKQHRKRAKRRANRRRVEKEKKKNDNIPAEQPAGSRQIISPAREPAQERQNILPRRVSIKKLSCETREKNTTTAEEGTDTSQQGTQPTDTDIRTGWSIGDRVIVYSITRKTWFAGRITRITGPSNNILQVAYGPRGIATKLVGRYDTTSVRPEIDYDTQLANNTPSQTQSRRMHIRSVPMLPSVEPVFTAWNLKDRQLAIIPEKSVERYWLHWCISTGDLARNPFSATTMSAKKATEELLSHFKAGIPPRTVFAKEVASTANHLKFNAFRSFLENVPYVRNAVCLLPFSVWETIEECFSQVADPDGRIAAKDMHRLFYTCMFSIFAAEMKKRIQGPVSFKEYALFRWEIDSGFDLSRSIAAASHVLGRNLKLERKKDKAFHDKHSSRSPPSAGRKFGGSTLELPL